MTGTTAKKTAAKKTTAAKKEEEKPVSPIKRSTRTVLSLEVEGVEYSGEVEVDDETLAELDEIAAKWDKVQVEYAKLTGELLDKMEEIGLEAPKPKKTSSASESKKIRRWAARVGLEVNQSGMIPLDVREKYEAAKRKGELEINEQ